MEEQTHTHTHTHTDVLTQKHAHSQLVKGRQRGIRLYENRPWAVCSHDPQQSHWITDCNKQTQDGATRASDWDFFVPFWKRPAVWLYFLISLISQRLFLSESPRALSIRKQWQNKEPATWAGPGALHEPDWTNCVVCVRRVGVCVCVCVSLWSHAS